MLAPYVASSVSISQVQVHLFPKPLAHRQYMKTYIQYIQYVQSVWLNTLGELMYKNIQSNIFNNRSTVYMITLVICDRIGIMYIGEIRISIAAGVGFMLPTPHGKGEFVMSLGKKYNMRKKRMLFQYAR